jgi:hypothetical protein
MNKTFIITLLGATFCISSAAMAAPMMWYNPVNGGIYFTNDHTGPLANMSVISSTGSLKTASSLLNIPGAVKDDSELPFAFTYLGLPVGQSFAGNIVQPGTPISDIRYEYRLNSLLEPLKRGVICDLSCPEPSSCLLAMATMYTLSMISRRVHRRR